MLGKPQISEGRQLVRRRGIEVIGPTRSHSGKVTQANTVKGKITPNSGGKQLRSRNIT